MEDIILDIVNFSGTPDFGGNNLWNLDFWGCELWRLWSWSF